MLVGVGGGVRGAYGVAHAERVDVEERKGFFGFEEFH